MVPWLCWLGLLASLTLAQSFTKGQKWQIILTGVPDTSKSPLPPIDAPIWDIDLFDTDTATITALKATGKTVICYFSAGTYENWRDDAKQFAAADLGKALPEWPDEKWLRVTSTAVRNIMAARIKMASDKGCDALDPDNTDGYVCAPLVQNDNGLNLKSSDAVDYITWIQKNASAYGMPIGLKNSIDILPSVSPLVEFAVNEQCAQLGECSSYAEFLASDKPVFHIEYPAALPASTADRNTDCSAAGTTGMSTVMKNMSLDGLVYYCDGSSANTPVKGGTSPPRPSKSPKPQPSHTTTRRSSRPPQTRTSLTRSTVATSKPTSTSATSTSTSVRPTSTPARTSSASRPTSSVGGGGGGGGCQAKHWDQCGGQNWNGCTTCVSPYTCKGVSPPYYYQCL